jgi:hypothetical protein
VVASRSTAITVKPARIPYSVTVKRPSFRKNLARTLSIRRALKQITQPHYAAAQLNGQLKLNCNPKIVTVVRGHLPAVLDHIRQLHHGESTD